MLNRLRKQKITPAAFAKKIGESDQSLSNWRRRGIPPAKVGRIAAELGMTYEQYMREAGQPLSVANQESAQYSIGRDALLDDYDHLPPWLQEHIARKTRELREYADALPLFLRESMSAPPTDPEAYRLWERNMEADRLRITRQATTKGAKT